MTYTHSYPDSSGPWLHLRAYKLVSVGRENQSATMAFRVHLPDYRWASHLSTPFWAAIAADHSGTEKLAHPLWSKNQSITRWSGRPERVTGCSHDCDRSISPGFGDSLISLGCRRQVLRVGNTKHHLSRGSTGHAYLMERGPNQSPEVRMQFTVVRRTMS